jgi:hypothetical protein
MFIFIFAVQNKKLRKKYIKLIKGIDVPNLEQAMIYMNEEVYQLQNSLEEQQQEMKQMKNKMKEMKSNLYIHRYSAFSDETTGLSYSVVILDDYHNGVVITGLYNREQSYTYAKPIELGQSKFKLSPEEKEALQRTIDLYKN